MVIKGQGRAPKQNAFGGTDSQEFRKACTRGSVVNNHFCPEWLPHADDSALRDHEACMAQAGKRVGWKNDHEPSKTLCMVLSMREGTDTEIGDHVALMES